MDEKVTVEFEPEEFEVLQHRADAHGHSVGDEVRVIVRQQIGRKSSAEIDFVAWARQIRGMTPTGIAQTDSLKLLREDRDR